MYIIGESDLDLSRGCCSCPLKTGGKFCGRLDHDDDVSQYIKTFTRPEYCPITHIPGSPRIVFVNDIKIHNIQEYHPELQRPGLMKKVVYLEDLKNATLDIGKK